MSDEENLPAPIARRWDRLIDNYEPYDDDPNVIMAMFESKRIYEEEKRFNDKINKLKKENELALEEERKKHEKNKKIIELDLAKEVEHRKNQVKSILENIVRLCKMDPKEKYMCDSLIRDFNKYIKTGKEIDYNIYFILRDEMGIDQKKLDKIDYIFEETYEDDYEYEG